MSDQYNFPVGYINAVLMDIKTYIQMLNPTEQQEYIARLKTNASIARGPLITDVGQDAVVGFDAVIDALLYS